LFLSLLIIDLLLLELIGGDTFSALLSYCLSEEMSLNYGTSILSIFEAELSATLNKDFSDCLTD